MRANGLVVPRTTTYEAVDYCRTGKHLGEEARQELEVAPASAVLPSHL